MADLSGVQNLDPNVEENVGGFTIVPTNWYKMVIVEDELKDTSTGGKMLVVKQQIVEGPYAGTVLSDRLNIINKSEKAQKIGQGTLKRLCNLTGQQYPPQNTEKMYGVPYAAYVVKSSFTSTRGENKGEQIPTNEIKKYDTVDALTNAKSGPPENKAHDSALENKAADSSLDW